MNEQEIAKYMLKGVIAEAPEEVRVKIEDAAARLRAIVAESDEAKVALALVVAETEVFE